MKLHELIVVSLAAGTLGAIAIPSYLRITEKPHFSQAQISIGNSLRYGGCPDSVNGWRFDCYGDQISGVKKKLKIVGAKTDDQILFCKGISGLSDQDLRAGACPDLASVR